MHRVERELPFLKYDGLYLSIFLGVSPNFEITVAWGLNFQSLSLEFQKNRIKRTEPGKLQFTRNRVALVFTYFCPFFFSIVMILSLSRHRAAVHTAQ